MNTGELIEQFLQKWNAKDQSGWSALFAENATLAAPGGVSGSGPEMVRTFYTLWQEAFPDNQCRMVRIIDGGASGVLEAVFEGTHTETLRAPGGEVPATGHRVSVPFVNVCEFSGGRLTDFVLYFDQVELLTQLGLARVPSG